MRDWLTARPIAHRGLHDAAAGVIENTASAFRAAIDGGYGIECDLQVSADGEAMVHHDDVLGRLTDGAGRLDAMTVAALQRVSFKATADRMMTLGDLLDLVAGRVTLLLELKSRFDRDARLARRVAEVVKTYAGPVAAMSFDPDQVEAVRDFAPALVRGLVAMRYRRADAEESGGQPSHLAYLAHALRCRPHFVAYNVKDLPAPAPLAARHLLAKPLLTWTVRTPEDRARAERFADQMIFEGFRP